MAAPVLLLLFVGPIDAEEAPAQANGAPPAYAPLPQESPYAEAMRKVTAGFKGTEGVVIHVGDSMTIANPYTTWPRQGKGRTADDLAVLKWMHLEKRDNTDGWWLCRHDYADHLAHTSAGGLTSAELHKVGLRKLPVLTDLLDKFNPQVVVLMVGAYDAEEERPAAEFKQNIATAVRQMLDRHAIPVLTTICPRHNHLQLTADYNKALRELASEHQLPLIDFEREIFRLRPDDWNGTIQRRDNIHLTAREAGGNSLNEPTPENLSKSGYHLRSWLTVKKLGEIKRTVIDPPASK